MLGDPLRPVSATMLGLPTSINARLEWMSHTTPARQSALVEYAIWKAMGTRRFNTPANNRKGTSLGIAKNKMILSSCPAFDQNPAWGIALVPAWLNSICMSRALEGAGHTPGNSEGHIRLEQRPEHVG